MLKNITTNKSLGFTDNQWGQLIEANGLLLMWFIEWNQVNDAVNKDKEKPLSIMDFFKQKYNMSAGGDPWAMKGKVSLDGKYVAESGYDDDEDLEPYFLINTDDGVGYIYPYAFVALPKKSGGHHIVRMD